MNEDFNRRALLNAETVPPSPCYTSRIQKGGALIEEMRELVRLWTDAPLAENKAEVIRMNPLNKATRARVVDVLNRIFVPRFIEGSIRDSWKLLRPLEDLKASSAVVRPIYFWLTARAEPLVYDFCTDYLASRRRQGLYAVNVTEAAAWVASKSAQWSENVNIKVTRAILAALRDFGVLECRARKTLSSPAVPLPSFAYIAFCLHQCGVAARNILDHPDWRLFLLDAAAVEHLLLEAHQLRLLPACSVWPPPRNTNKPFTKKAFHVHPLTRRPASNPSAVTHWSKRLASDGARAVVSRRRFCTDGASILVRRYHNRSTLTL